MSDRTHLAWQELLGSVARQGYGYAPDLVDASLLADLQAEARGLTYTREHLVTEKVQLEYDWHAVDDPGAFSRYPALGALVDGIASRVRASGKSFTGVDGYEINRASFQWYQPGQVGVTPHLDPAHNRVLVFVVSVWGEGEFGVTDERSWDTPRERFVTSAGDVIALRAPGFNGVSDGRVLHYARPLPHAERISLGLRMEVARTPVAADAPIR